MNEAQRKQVQSILDAADDLTIATNRADGYPQATTVSYVNDGLSLYFGTSSMSQKTLNLARDPRVSVTINRPYGNWSEIQGLSLGGRAVRVRAAEELGRVGALMVKKFPQVADYVQNAPAGELALFRIDPEVISLLDYTAGFGHTETFNVQPRAA